MHMSSALVVVRGVAFSLFNCAEQWLCERARDVRLRGVWTGLAGKVAAQTLSCNRSCKEYYLLLLVWYIQAEHRILAVAAERCSEHHTRHLTGSAGSGALNQEVRGSPYNTSSN